MYFYYVLNSYGGKKINFKWIKKIDTSFNIIIYFFILIIIAVFIIGLLSDSRENGYINVSSLKELPGEYSVLLIQLLTFSLGVFYGAILIVISLDRKKRLNCILILLASLVVVAGFRYVVIARPETFFIGLLLGIIISYKTKLERGDHKLYEKSMQIIGFFAMFSVWISLANYMLGKSNFNTSFKYFWLAIAFNWVFIKFLRYEVSNSKVFVVGPSRAGKTVFMSALYEKALQQNKNLNVISDHLADSLSEIYDGRWPIGTSYNKKFEFSYEQGILFIKEVTIEALDYGGQDFENEINNIVQYIKNKKSNNTLKPKDEHEEIAEGIFNANKLFFLIDGARIGMRKESGDFIQKYYLKILRELPDKPYCIIITKSDIYMEIEGRKIDYDYENLKSYILEELHKKEPFFKQFESQSEAVLPVFILEKENKPLLSIDNKFITFGFDEVLEKLANESRFIPKQITKMKSYKNKSFVSDYFETIIQNMVKINSIQQISEFSNNISSLYIFKDPSFEDFNNVIKDIEIISIDAKKYIESSSNTTKYKNFIVLQEDIEKLNKTLDAVRILEIKKFLSIAEKWSDIIKKERSKITESKDSFKEIINPYIFGRIMEVDETSRIFVIRDDIVDEIRLNLSNISQKPTLFLYGRRRVGKSSVLKNLQYLLGNKQYLCVYIDCQQAGTSLTSFWYYLSKAISESLKENGFLLENPELETFQYNPFIIIDNWFDEVEKILEKENTIIIALDEYERLEESILEGTLSREILNQLRGIIQHRNRFVIFISGSKELNELGLNWSDYLISAKTIKLGYLPEEDARKLITNPIDDFGLNYQGGVKGAVVNKIIEITNCQPFLVQALCFEVVKYLNSQHRKEARIEDIDIAIEKVMGSAEIYFHHIWNVECSEKEKELLKRLSNNISINGNEKEINSLIRKEVIEKSNGDYKFKVELMKKWIETQISPFKQI